MQQALEWHKVADVDDLADGRVRTVVAGDRSLALTRFGDRYGALDNHCPHQGGPLGEGSIEKGWLRCPWHGYDYDPITGTPPPGFTDAPACFPVEVRDDGVYVGLDPTTAHVRARSPTSWSRRWSRWGVTHVFGMVGHSNLGFADAMRRQEEAGNLTFIGIRHEGAAAFAASAYGKLTGRPGGVLRHRRSRARPTCSPGSTTPRSTARRCSRSPARCRRRCSAAARSRTSTSPPRSPTWPRTRRRCCPTSDHAELMTPRAEARAARARRRPPRAPRRGAGAAGGRERRRRGPVGRVGRPRDRAARRARSTTRSRCSAGARRPVIVVGHGARFDMDDVARARRGARRAGRSPRSRPRAWSPTTIRSACGVLGRSGTPIASWLMNESDLLHRLRRVVLEPHRHRRTTSRSSRSTSTRWRSDGSTR